MAKAKKPAPADAPEVDIVEAPAEVVETVTDEITETPAEVTEEVTETAPEVVEPVVPVVPEPVRSHETSIESTLFQNVDFTTEQVYSNSITLPWPQDQYGFTSEFKAAFTKMVSRLAGDPEKRKVLDETLEVAQKHLDVKYARDNAEREGRIASIIVDTKEAE